MCQVRKARVYLVLGLVFWLGSAGGWTTQSETSTIMGYLFSGTVGLSVLQC